MKSFTRKTVAYSFCMAIIVLSASLFAAEPKAPVTQLEKNMPYYGPEKMKGADDYMKVRCTLDLLYPTGKKGFATIVPFSRKK